jgi:N-acyl-D-amino-acid deacylase
VHRMSGMTAARLKLFDRGLLRPGMKADIVIFDPDTVVDKAEYDKPHQYAIGFSEVIVNGKAIIDNGQLTKERPGRLLYGPAKR